MSQVFGIAGPDPETPPGRQAGPGSAAGRIARDLRDRIFAAELAVGSPLREVELVERYGASRHTVREALRELAGLGLVVQDPHRSARVRELTRADVRDLFGLRRVLELEALRRLIEQDAPVEPLQRAVRQRERAELAADASGPGRPGPVPPGQLSEVDADLDFHRAVVLAPGSPRLARAFDAVAAELRLAFLALLHDSGDRGDHRAILEAVLARDGESATALLDLHIRDGLRICSAAARA